jgi:hypothetical protein
MASPKPITVPIPAQPAPGRIQSDRTWAPKKPYTSRREYSFMRHLGVFANFSENPRGGNFGPLDGGMGVEL